MKLFILPWLLFGVLLNAGAQLALKAGSQRISDVTFSWNNAIPMGWQLATNPYIIMGLVAYVISVVIWIGVLSRVDVSVAYPMVSIGYIINAVAAWYLFGESMSAIKVSGIFLILAGVYLVARS
ncbi:MAG TPA: SMR family transporter [Gammaproteobacteria bacterium]|nr:SMR family transporter [Gammaproteobacteria bacterium]